MSFCEFSLLDREGKKGMKIKIIFVFQYIFTLYDIRSWNLKEEKNGDGYISWWRIGDESDRKN